MPPLVLASGSFTRAALLRAADVAFQVHPVRVDEDSVRRALTAENVPPRDQSDVLADLKARRGAHHIPDAVVLGADQILDLDGICLAKPTSVEEARTHLVRLRGHAHKLHSAMVIYEGSRPVWRHISTATLHMRAFSDQFLEDYLAKYDTALLQTVG